MSDDSKKDGELLNIEGRGISTSASRSISSKQRREIYARVKPGWEEEVPRPSDFFREREDISRHLTGPGSLRGGKHFLASFLAIICLVFSISLAIQELRVEKFSRSHAGEWGAPTSVPIDEVPVAYRTKQSSLNSCIEEEDWTGALNMASGIRDDLAAGDSEFRNRIADAEYAEFQRCLASCLVWIPHFLAREATHDRDSKYEEAVENYKKISDWNFSTGPSASFCSVNARGQISGIERLQEPTDEKLLETPDGEERSMLESLLSEVEEFRSQNAPAISGDESIRRDVDFLEGFVLAKLLFERKERLGFWGTRFDRTERKKQVCWERLAELLDAMPNQARSDEKFTKLRVFFLESAMTFNGDPIVIGEWQGDRQSLKSDLEELKKKQADQTAGK